MAQDGPKLTPPWQKLTPSLFKLTPSGPQHCMKAVFPENIQKKKEQKMIFTFIVPRLKANTVHQHQIGIKLAEVGAKLKQVGPKLVPSW